MLEKIKERLQRRIERNTFKSELTWTNKEGEVHNEEVLIKRSQIPIIGDWARIYPPIDERGRINWINVIFGGWKNLVKLIFVLVLVGLVVVGFKELFTSFQSIIDLPCVQQCLEVAVE